MHLDFFVTKARVSEDSEDVMRMVFVSHSEIYA